MYAALLFFILTSSFEITAQIPAPSKTAKMMNNRKKN